VTGTATTGRFRISSATLRDRRGADTIAIIRYRAIPMEKADARGGSLLRALCVLGGVGVNRRSQSRKLTAAITISVMNADINAMSITSPAMIRSPCSGRPHSRRGLRALLQGVRKAAAGCRNCDRAWEGPGPIKTEPRCTGTGARHTDRLDGGNRRGDPGRNLTTASQC
jgi:hypothetical protein